MPSVLKGKAMFRRIVGLRFPDAADLRQTKVPVFDRVATLLHRKDPAVPIAEVRKALTPSIRPLADRQVATRCTRWTNA